MPVTGTPTTPNLTSGWPIYVGHLPDKPDNAICIYDTSGVADGRDMRSEETITHPGWQVRVRATDYGAAQAKMKEVQKFLDTIRRTAVTIDGDDYRLEAVRQTGTPLALGQEQKAQRRDTITLNGTLTMKELN